MHVSSTKREDEERVGRILYTGPDGVGDHRTTVLEAGYVGHSERSPEATGDLQYVYRPAKVFYWSLALTLFICSSIFATHIDRGREKFISERIFVLWNSWFPI